MLYGDSCEDMSENRALRTIFGRMLANVSDLVLRALEGRVANLEKAF